MLYVNPLAGNKALAAADGAKNSPARRAAALQEFEHYFLLTMLKEMRKTAPGTGLLDGGQGTAFFREMLDDALSAEMAKSGQFGIAKSIEAQWEAEASAKVQRL